MKKIISAVTFALVLSGCTTTGTQAIRDQSNFGALKIGATTKSDIYAKFGQPHDVFDYLGRQGWRYIHVASSPEPVTFVLGVIFFPLIALQQTDNDVSQSDFFFDDAGHLLDSTSRKSQIRQSLLSVGDSFTEKQKSSVVRIRSEMEKTNLPFDEKTANGSLAYLAI